MSLIYEWGGIELLDIIAPLWEALNLHHYEKSVHFKSNFKSNSFEKRKKRILEKSNTHEFHIGLAKEETRNPVAYCLSSAKDDLGEIESIFVIQSFRGKGLGEKLMEEALAWLENKGVSTIRIGVVTGNEEAFSFYERYGFYPKVSILSR